MSDPTTYSGTAEFPAVPDTKLPERPPFEFAEQPWFPPGLCPTFDPAIELDIVPAARQIPTYTRPLIKPVVTVPMCQPPPLVTDCIPFTPMSTAAFTINGRRYFGNNLMDRAWCTVASMLSFDVNTANMWRAEWTDPNEDIQATIRKGGPYRITVYGGKIIKHGPGNVVVTEHWPSLATGRKAEMPAAMEAGSSYETSPADNTVSGFWNKLPSSPKAAVQTSHPSYTNGGYSGYGKVVPADTAEDGVVCKTFEYTGTLPAYIYYKFGTSQPAHAVIAAVAEADTAKMTMVSYDGRGPAVPQPGSGSVVVSDAATTADDGDNAYTEMLAVIGADGRIIQQKSGPIEEYWDPKPWQIFYFQDQYIIYLPNIMLWSRNSTKGTNDITLSASSKTPPFGKSGAWYTLGVTFDRETEKTSGEVSVWAKLKGDTGNYYAEDPQWNLAECQVDCLTAGYDEEYLPGIRDEDAVLIGKISEDGTVDQYMVGTIVQATKIPSDLIGQPWDISFELLDCTISNCLYQSGPVVGSVSLANNGKFTLGLEANAKAWIGVVINTETMKGTVLTGGSLAAVSDFPTSTPPFVKLPLYEVIALPTINRYGVTDLRLAKTFDCRHLPQLPLYN